MFLAVPIGQILKNLFRFYRLPKVITKGEQKLSEEKEALVVRQKSGHQFACGLVDLISDSDHI